MSILLRSISKGAAPPVPFVIVAAVATALLLIGWRTAFAATKVRGPPRTAACENGGRNVSYQVLLLLGTSL